MLFRISTNIMSILIPVGEKPSCLQATLASGVPHESSHTVPHCMLLQISTLPSIEFDPTRSLMSPFEQRANEMRSNRRNGKVSHQVSPNCFFWLIFGLGMINCTVVYSMNVGIRSFGNMSNKEMNSVCITYVDI